MIKLQWLQPVIEGTCSCWLFIDRLRVFARFMRKTRVKGLAFYPGFTPGISTWRIGMKDNNLSFMQHGRKDNRICFQRILHISLQTGISFFFRVAIHFQKSVNCLSFITCRFCHSLCRTPCRSGQINIHSLTFKIVNHSINCCCLSCSVDTDDSDLLLLIYRKRCLVK